MKDRQAGFTLIEQIVVLSVAGVMLPVLSGFFLTTFLRPVENSAALATSQDVRTASEWVSRDLASGPMGNNLAVSGGPSLTSVTIGPSPGYSGNNSLTITYHTWPTVGSTDPETHSIVYRLEDLDPNDDDIQLVRREDDGAATTVVHHILDAADVVFSGSAQSGAGGVSSGITMSITSKQEGSATTVTRQASFVYTLPRSYEPTPAPAPSAQTWNLAPPYYLAGKSGYWQVITTSAEGTISANWQIASSAAIQVLVYPGEPMGTGGLGGSTLTPSKVNATAVASNSATTNNLTATTAASQPAAKYTVYIYNGSNDYVSTNAATASYVSP